MAEYYFIKNYNNYGKLAINRNVFKSIAIEAVNKVQGASVSSKKNKKNEFKIDAPIDVTFHKNGQVELKIDISIKKEANPTKVSVAIQEEVNSALQQYTESVPFAITINVASII